MTNERVSGFASELVQMATAAAKLPELEAQAEALTIRCESLRDTIQRLELKAMDRNAEIIDLNATIRKLEVERDNAETMFLEADDKASAWRRLVGSFQADAEALLKAQEPPKPEPIVEPKPIEGFPGNPVAGTFPEPMNVVGAETGRWENTQNVSEGVSVQPDPITGPSGQPNVENEVTSLTGTTQEHPVGATAPAGTLQHDPLTGAITVSGLVPIPGGQSETDPMPIGPSGPLVQPQSGLVADSSSVTSPSQGSTTPTEAKPGFDWPYM